MQVISASTLVDDDASPPRVITDSFIRLVAGSLGLVHGAPNVGKSHLAVSTAVHAAANEARVLLLLGETSPSALRKRFRGALDIAGFEPDVLHRIDVVTRPPVLDDHGFDDLYAAVEASKAELVVVDPVVSVLVGDENSSRDVGTFMRGIAELTMQDTAVLLVHHDRKGGVGVSADLRGSSVFRASADDIFALSENDGATVVRHTKARDTERRPDVTFRVVTTETGVGIEEISGPPDNGLGAAELALLTILEEGDYNLADLKRMTKRSGEAISTAIARLQAAGRIEVDSHPPRGRRGRPSRVARLVR